MPSETIPVTCDLDSGETVLFDAPYTEAADFDSTSYLFSLFASAVGK